MLNINMEINALDRTVFILDCHPNCAEQSTQCDEYCKNLPQRSIWSCFIEGIHEYSRIFYDLSNSDESMLSVQISNGTSNNIINNWNDIEQIPEQISKGLLSVNLEKIESKIDRIKISIIQALKSLQEENNEHKFDTINGKIILLLLDNSYFFNIDKSNVNNKKNIFRYYESKDDSFDIRNILTSAWEEFTNNKTEKHNKLEDCTFNIIKVIDADEEYVNRYTQDIYYYQVNDNIMLSIYYSPILKVLNCIRNLYQLQNNLYTLTVTDIPIKINSETNNKYSVNLFYSGNGHFTTTKQEKRRFFDNTFFNNRTTIVKWKSQKPTLKYNNSTKCIHRITPTDISNDITSLFIKFILNNNTFFYFSPYDNKTVSWDKEQPVISHMIYFDNGCLFLACIEQTRPNNINLPSLPKIKEICKLKCEVS